MAEEELMIVELTGEDGEIVKCEVYDVIDFEDKTYALLYPVCDCEEEDCDCEEDGLIIMEYVEEGDDDGYFQDIEDEEEFNRVYDYIESIWDEEDNEEE